MTEHITKILAFEEGFSHNPYYDSLGYPTIGIGKKIGPRHVPLHCYTFTLTKKLAEQWLFEDIKHLEKNMKRCKSIYDAMKHCNEARTDMLLSMTYQMGIGGVSHFKKMLAAIKDDDFDEAKREGLNSLWARQTPVRAKRQMNVMLKGDYSPYAGLI